MTRILEAPMTRTLLALLFSACADPITTTTLDDVGAACSDGAEITVTFPGCLSSSCDTLTEATCEATLDGTTIRVTGHAVITSQGNECTADCGTISATCALPDGADPDTMTLAYAGDEGPVEACQAP
jgi:hypothetical protein